jgi:hypothetical protein
MKQNAGALSGPSHCHTALDKSTMALTKVLMAVALALLVTVALATDSQGINNSRSLISSSPASYSGPLFFLVFIVVFVFHVYLTV